MPWFTIEFHREDLKRLNTNTYIEHPDGGELPVGENEIWDAVGSAILEPAQPGNAPRGAKEEELLADDEDIDEIEYTATSNDGQVFVMDAEALRRIRTPDERRGITHTGATDGATTRGGRNE